MVWGLLLTETVADEFDGAVDGSHGDDQAGYPGGVERQAYA